VCLLTQALWTELDFYSLYYPASYVLELPSLFCLNYISINLHITSLVGKVTNFKTVTRVSFADLYFKTVVIYI